MEWDTAAADAILRSVGGNLYDEKLNKLEYNKENLLNPNFIGLKNDSLKNTINS